jgi:hypothetical protein
MRTNPIRDILVMGISNGCSSVGLFVYRLQPLPSIQRDFSVDSLIIDGYSFDNDHHKQYRPVGKPYGKHYRKSFLGKNQ